MLTDLTFTLHGPTPHMLQTHLQSRHHLQDAAPSQTCTWGLVVPSSMLMYVAYHGAL